MRVIAAAAVLLALSGCAGLRPVEPTSMDHGLLFVRATVRGALISFTSDEADRAEIEMLDEQGQAVPGKVAASGFTNDGGIYFLDLPPGRYALTSISFPARGARYEVVLSSAVMRPAAVELKRGEAAFMGELTLLGIFPPVDVAFDRATDLLGRWLLFFLRWSPIPRDADLRPIDRGPKAEHAALLAARRDLAGSQWQAMIDARLRALAQPDAPARSGTLRKREIQLTPETFFSWRDTLKWGKPERSSNGVAWRRPGGEARLVVFFTSATLRGFAGYDEAVRQMRAAANGPEDSLFEVRVGTRTGQAARSVAYAYARGTLVGSEARVTVTENVLIRDPLGMFTARLRAPRGEFEKVLPAFREFLLQLVLGPPAPVKPASESEPVLP